MGKGNEHIKFKNKYLCFLSWINSGILLINDIINEHGEIDENVILRKLENKTYWISEINIVKTGMPITWRKVLKSEESTKSIVKKSWISLFKNK